MRMLRTASFLVCSLVFSSNLLAQESKGLSALPAEGFQFTGTWDCEGMFGNGKVHKSTFTAAVILEGKWLELTEKDVQPTTGYVAKYLIGYDSEQKRLVEFDANNFGAAVYTSDDGWQKNVLTMTSSLSHDAKAPYAANRFQYSVVGKDAFTVSWQVSKTADLSWVQADHLTCNRRTKG